MNNTLRSIIVIGISILLVFLAISLFVWFIPVIIVGILIVTVYVYIKNSIYKRKHKRKESDTVYEENFNSNIDDEYENHKVVDVDYEDIDNKK
ncbi:hypothetical protein [Clostridium fallax]|uniref:Uncharacterized protein n=1 Tax=Clostridium fallax TaxID=1533 RepID=A0A1M4VW03_9CLOT|nr:hypothetical protein [Clostridium fallax]SHE72912.1 hypothetical protein SAMN05443638_10941 [Clostridium fallax]SQB07713.1 Uncharacterised protein [Clostridium fallax]